MNQLEKISSTGFVCPALDRDRCKLLKKKCPRYVTKDFMACDDYNVMLLNYSRKIESQEIPLR